MAAPKGNQYAVGNRGGGAPLGNKNAEKHGAYSRITFEDLTEEEWQILAGANYGVEQLLLEEIALLQIRERRIMALIRVYSSMGSGMAITGMDRRETKREFDSDEEQKQYKKVQREGEEAGRILPGKEYDLSTEMRAACDIICRLENLLSRCQAQMQKCIVELCKYRRCTEGSGGKPANLLDALLGAVDPEESVLPWWGDEDYLD